MVKDYTITRNYTYSIVCVILRLAVLIEHLLVTDRQTDGHTMTAYTTLA